MPLDSSYPPRADIFDVRAAISMVVREHGAFPITLRNGEALLGSMAISTETQDGHPAFVSAQRYLKRWPKVSFRYSYAVGYRRFHLDEWMSEEWCQTQMHFVGHYSGIMMASSMIGNDPLTHANLVIANAFTS